MPIDIIANEVDLLVDASELNAMAGFVGNVRDSQLIAVSIIQIGAGSTGLSTRPSLPTIVSTEAIAWRGLRHSSYGLASGLERLQEHVRRMGR